MSELTITRYFEKNRIRRQNEKNPLISFRSKLVYFPISKVASSTVKDVLYRAEVEGTSIKSPQFSSNPAASPFILPYQLPTRRLENILTDQKFKKVVFVRSPFSRTLSCFLDRVQEKGSRPRRLVNSALGRVPEADEQISFYQFLDVLPDILNADQHWRPQSIDCAWEHIDFDFVGKFESFEESLLQLLSRYYPKFRGDIGIQHKQTGASEKLRSYYDVDSIRAVRDMYGSDFEAFDYSDSPY